MLYAVSMTSTATTTNPYAAAWRGLHQAVSDFDRFDNTATKQNALGRMAAYADILCVLTGREMADVLAHARSVTNLPDWMREG